MSLPRPTVAVAVVFLLGVPLVAAPFAVPTPDSSRTYDAVAVDPSVDTAVVTRRTDVRNLTALADTETSRQTLDRAVDGETVRVGTADAELSSLDDAAGYAVYRGNYYRLRARQTGSSDTGDPGTGESGADDTGTDASTTTQTPAVDSSAFEPFTLTLRPVSGAAVLAELAVPYDETDPATRRIVDEGEGVVEATDGDAPVVVGAERVPSVVVRDDTYYVLDRTNELAPITDFVGFFLHRTVLPALQRLGVTYVGLAVGVYGLTAARGRSDPVTERTALGAVGGLTLLQLAVAAGQASAVSVGAPTATSTAAPIVGSLPPTVGRAGLALLIGAVAAISTLPVSGTLLVGTSWRRHGFGRRVALAAAGVFGALLLHAVLAAAMAGTILPAVFTTFVGGLGLATGLPVALLGYTHASDTAVADSV
ncbi:hypothetical protein RYH80_15845 [Halobaculum sp. MBLA0147]|uniref:hypothetical protein n=1 Tax=Halobaculum sp. MBLA0147 TaxID=3079934 RepID=UPI0035264168